MGTDVGSEGAGLFKVNCRSSVLWSHYARGYGSFHACANLGL